VHQPPAAHGEGRDIRGYPTRPPGQLLALRAVSRVKLTRDQRSAILRGERCKLEWDTRPEVEPGDELVLSRSRPQAHFDAETETVLRAPSTPLVTIVVRKLVRSRRGMWNVLFDVLDKRQPGRYLRRTPGPPYGDYTSSPRDAVDHLEVVDDREQQRGTKTK
jgi:hypothetical protein